MLVEASVSGLFKTLLMILGAFVLLRFFGNWMTAKRNMEEERALNERERKYNEEKKRVAKNFGKTSILPKFKKDPKSYDAEEVDYEDLSN